jgi:hypothetical protein
MPMPYNKYIWYNVHTHTCGHTWNTRYTLQYTAVYIIYNCIGIWMMMCYISIEVVFVRHLHVIYAYNNIIVIIIIHWISLYPKFLVKTLKFKRQKRYWLFNWSKFSSRYILYVLLNNTIMCHRMRNPIVYWFLDDCNNSCSQRNMNYR